MTDVIPPRGRAWRFWTAVAVAALLTVLLRSPSYLRRQAYNLDEGTLAAVASVILDGGLPYRDAWDTRGPVTFYLYAAVFALFGRNDMLAVHVLLMATVVLSCALLMLVGRRLGSPGAGEAAGVLYAVASFTYLPMDMLAANVELFMVPFILGGILLATGPPGRGGWRLIASGVCFGLAFLTKQPALADFAATGAFVLWTGRKAGRRETAWRGALLAGGFLFPVAMTAAAWACAGALGDFIFGFWTYYARYFMPAMEPARRVMMVFTGPWPLIRANPVLWASGLGGFVWLTLDLTGGRRAEPRHLPVVWLVSSFAAASASGRGFGHYYIQVLPPLCLLAALLAVDLFPAAAGRPARALLPGASRLTALARLLLPVALAAGWLLPVASYWQPGRLRILARAPAILREPVAQRNERAMGEAMRTLVRHLRRGSGPEDPVFVWGFYPQVHLLADRPPASRFVYGIYLTGLVPWVNVRPRVDTSRWIVPGSWDLLMGDLERRPPLFIVDTSPGNVSFWRKYPMRKFPRLESFVNGRYELDLVVRGKGGRERFHVWRRRNVDD